MTNLYHAITPGDHFSPRTGSAIPTVVHGLAHAAADDPASHHHVLVDRSTWEPRYTSATVVDYQGVPAPARRAVIADRLRGRAGLRRSAEIAWYEPMLAQLRGLPAGVVVAHNAAAVVPQFAAAGHAVVAYAHNALPRSMTRHELGRLLEPCGAVVCVSTALAEHTSARLPRSLRERVHVVGNGVDTSTFTPGSPASPLQVICVARMIPHKGVDVLLEAAALLRPGSAEVVVVGSRGFDAAAPLSAYERRLRELVTASAVPVRFIPFVDRDTLPRLLARAAILVVPSRWQEPSALTAGEGMASGLPVIASRVGGIPEVVGDAGVVVPPEDPVALAAAITALIDDPHERAERGERGRSRALEHDWNWSWAALARVVEDL